MIANCECEITKEQFESYLKVRNSGKYNMITECVIAAGKANLSINQYRTIINNFDELMKKYGK